MVQPVNTKLGGVFNFVNQVVESATEFPGEIMAFGRNLNDELIKYAERIQGQLGKTAETAESNLTQNEIQAYGSEFASWISNPTNVILVILAIVAIVIGIRKL